MAGPTHAPPPLPHPAPPQIVNPNAVQSFHIHLSTLAPGFNATYPDGVGCMFFLHVTHMLAASVSPEQVRGVG